MLVEILCFLQRTRGSTAPRGGHPTFPSASHTSLGVHHGDIDAAPFFFCNCHLWKFGYAQMGATRSWIIWLAAHHYRGGRYLRFERRKYGSDQSWFKGSASTECWTQRQATSVRCRALASFHALHIWYQRVEPYMFMSFILVPMSIYS